MRYENPYREKSGSVNKKTLPPFIGSVRVGDTLVRMESDSLEATVLCIGLALRAKGAMRSEAGTESGYEQ